VRSYSDPDNKIEIPGYLAIRDGIDGNVPVKEYIYGYGTKVFYVTVAEEVI
jgi:hypothetical protein